jgi:molecular chaperone GrpE
MDERGRRGNDAADGAAEGDETRVDPGAGDGRAEASDGRDHEECRRQLEDTRRELQDKQDRLLRALAEADNVRRRAQREREEYLKYANESLVRDLVPVVDNLDRALGAARSAGNAANVVEGVELIQRELLKVLERAGVTRYSAVGERFDPTRHEAISRVVSAEQPSGTVVHEVGPGYLLNGRGIRAALVAVAAAPDEDAA